jgi:hypothetical protein
MEQHDRDLLRGTVDAYGSSQNTRDIIANALRLSHKRKELCKKANQCPECGTMQVQLVEWIERVEWRRRECKHKWGDGIA